MFFDLTLLSTLVLALIAPSVANQLNYTSNTLTPTNATHAIVARDWWIDETLNRHNSARARFGAAPLTWNAGLMGSTQDWANRCGFAHSGGNYGENLAAGTGGFSLGNGVDLWVNEFGKYDFNRPDFSAETGHFTQVVWKNTKSVACAMSGCPSASIFNQPSNFLVCRYDPPGNYLGQFGNNVGRPQW